MSSPAPSPICDICHRRDGMAPHFHDCPRAGDLIDALEVARRHLMAVDGWSRSDADAIRQAIDLLSAPAGDDDDELLPCPHCGTTADEDGYCVDPGCRMVGKAVIGLDDTPHLPPVDRCGWCGTVRHPDDRAGCSRCHNAWPTTTFDIPVTFTVTVRAGTVQQFEIVPRESFAGYFGPPTTVVSWTPAGPETSEPHHTVDDMWSMVGDRLAETHNLIEVCWEE